MPRDKVDKPQPNNAAVMSFPQPPLRNAQEYLKAYSGYPYTAISAIAQEVASIDLHLFKTKFVRNGKPESQEIYEHEALSTLRYVNPLTTFYDIVEATQIYLELTGEAFWLILKEGQTPREAWLIRPDWVKIIPSKDNIIDHYTYHPGGGIEKVDIPRENIIHFKYFHPLNPYRGKGSLQSAALPLDTLTFAQEYNRNFFFNSAIPSMVFTTDKNLSEKLVKRFMTQWQASYGGRAKSNKVAFLGNGLKLDTVTQGAKELDFAEQQKMMRDDVLAVFKVPKTVLGMVEDVNRANALATTRAFMERVITPRMKKFVGTLTEFFLPMFGDKNLFFDFVDPAPEDVELKLKRYESGLKWGWLTANEVRAEENLEPLEGGDELSPRGGSLSIGGTEESTAPEEAPAEEGTEEEQARGLLAKWFGKKKVKVAKRPLRKILPKPFKHMMPIPVKRPEDLRREQLEKALAPKVAEFIGQLLKKENVNNLGLVEENIKLEKNEDDEPLFNEEQKDAYWRQFINMVTEREAELRNKAVELFNEQESLILDNLDKEVKHWRKDFRKGKAGSVLPTLEDLSNLWMRVYLDILREIYIEQGNYILDFLGVGGNIDITTRFASQYLRTYGAILIEGINETTREKLLATLSAGFDAEESVEQLKKRVKEVFKEATSSRAEMIARTEALRASNAATVEGYRQSGVVEAKEWLSERDERTCPFCQSMDGKTLGLNKFYFKSGDTLEVDGKTLTIGNLDVGEPPLHPNCRCTTIPVLLGES